MYLCCISKASRAARRIPSSGFSSRRRSRALTDLQAHRQPDVPGRNFLALQHGDERPDGLGPFLLHILVHRRERRAMHAAEEDIVKAHDGKILRNADPPVRKRRHQPHREKIRDAEHRRIVLKPSADLIQGSVDLIMKNIAD